MDSNVTSKESSIEISCHYAETRFVASIDMRSVPENDSLSNVVEAVTESGKLLVNIKVFWLKLLFM